MSGSRRTAVVIVVASALVVVACVVALAIEQQLYASIAAWHSPLLWLLGLVLLGALGFAAALGAALGRPSVALVGVMACWVGVVVVASDAAPDGVRAVLMAAAALAAPVSLASSFPVVGRRPRRAVWRGVVAACVISAPVVLLAYDPLLDPRCVSMCDHNPWALGHVGALAWLPLVVTVVVLLVVGADVLLRQPSTGETASTAAGTTALVDAALAAVGLVEVARPTAALSAAVLAVALLATGTLVSLVLASDVRIVRARRRVARLVSAMSASPEPAGLDRALSDALGGTVTVAYPELGDDGEIDGYVDGSGTRRDDVEQEGRIELRSRGEVVAVLSGAGADGVVATDGVDRLAPLASLVVENASYVARRRARIARVTAARAAVVAASDAARERLERDLHDGAQQLVLALALDLRRLATSVDPLTPAGRAVQEALADVGAALDELRAVAHGIHPAEIDAGGLRAALDVLAEDTGAAIALDGDVPGAASPEVRLAVYRLIERVVEAEARGSGLRIDVDIVVHDAAVDVLISGAPSTTVDLGSEVDRVLALGGTVERLPAGDGAHVRLPLPL